MLDITFTVPINYNLIAFLVFIIGIIPVFLAIRLGIKKRRKEILEIEDTVDAVALDLDAISYVESMYEGKLYRINMTVQEVLDWEGKSRQEKRRITKELIKSTVQLEMQAKKKAKEAALAQ